MKEKMKDKIVYAALELACEKGLAGVTMSQIARRVGLQKSSLYSHFSSKEDIIVEMYELLRNRAKVKSGSEETDYERFVENKSLREILQSAVMNYKKMNLEDDMAKFYRVIMSERSINKDAAAIMVKETQKMILATKQLFCAISNKNIATFENPDAAAVTFAMGVHSILDYECDLMMAGEEASQELMADFIDEFCRCYNKS